MRIATAGQAVLVLAFLMLLVGTGPVYGKEEKTMIDVDGIVRDLVAVHGPGQQERITAGVRRAADLWRSGDGTPDDFRDMCRQYYVADPATLAATFDRLETNLEVVWGRSHQISRALSSPLDLDTGPILPVDPLFAAWSPLSHLADDFFSNRLAFVVALNFPHYTLKEKLERGEGWDRRQWAMARLGDFFTSRVPAELNQRLAAQSVAAHRYVSEYNIRMDRLLTPEHKTLFPEGLVLLNHWGLREEIRGRYADPDGRLRQEMIYRVMERIIDQSIPADVVNNPAAYWDPAANTVYRKTDDGFVEIEAHSSANRRYELLLKQLALFRQVDRYHPEAPTYIDRMFEINRQIPEAEMERLLVSVLASPRVAEVGRLIRERLARPLRPYDIWYNGFKATGGLSEAELDRRVAARYPDPAAFQKDIPRILRQLGFSPERADFIGSRIVVDPARGSGHAMGISMRGDRAHLRTRVPAGGMNYKGYNIAVHEMGHNVEQEMTMEFMDHYLLHGVPNSAFTEAFAMLFQDRHLQLLGIAADDPRAEALGVLDEFWNTYEIAGVGLMDMRVWRWMYAHPDATPARLEAAVADIARGVWNEYYAPVFGVKDSPILAVYAHMVNYPAYLANYPMGHIIMFQIRRYMEGKNLGAEMERMCRLGNLTPSLWMKRAVGEPISAAPLLEATAEALRAVTKP